MTIDDVGNLFRADSIFNNRIAVLREMWHHVVDRGYGGALPFGRLWDRVLGLARFYASFNPPRGGRKAEFIQTHYFCTHFGEQIQCGAGVPAVDFYLLPAWEELTDADNPLALFPRYRDLVGAARAMCGLPTFHAFDVGAWSYTGFELPAGVAHIDTQFYMGTLVAQAGAQSRLSLVECFNAFAKGPPRTVIFLMFLNDMRQLNSAAPIPAGAANPRINPALLSAADAAEIFLHLDAFQSKKVIAIYSQQCHGNHHCLPVDTWIAAFLAYPLAAAEYNTGSGTPRATNANLAAVAVFIGAANHFGKVERLLWITAQARKIHSTVCNDALWCVKESGDSKARGANPLTCKACNVAIRNVCPAHLAIEHLIVAFNGSDAEAPFNLITSSADNTTQGQRFARCEGHGDMEGLLDEDTPTDSAGSFTVPYPAQGHQNGAVLSVEDFIALY